MTDKELKQMLKLDMSKAIDTPAESRLYGIAIRIEGKLVDWAGGWSPGYVLLKFDRSSYLTPDEHGELKTSLVMQIEPITDAGHNDDECEPRRVVFYPGRVRPGTAQDPDDLFDFSDDVNDYATEQLKDDVKINKLQDAIVDILERNGLIRTDENGCITGYVNIPQKQDTPRHECRLSLATVKEMVAIYKREDLYDRSRNGLFYAKVLDPKPLPRSGYTYYA